MLPDDILLPASSAYSYNKKDSETLGAVDQGAFPAFLLSFRIHGLSVAYVETIREWGLLGGEILGGGGGYSKTHDFWEGGSVTSTAAYATAQTGV